MIFELKCVGKFAQLQHGFALFCCAYCLCLMTTAFKCDQNQCRELTSPHIPSGSAVSDEDSLDAVRGFQGSDSRGTGGEVAVSERTAERRAVMMSW